jgi:hypothetical protein
MLRSVILALALAVSLSACSTASVRSQEGHACSTSSSDDPQLVCTPAQDLICIATYSKVVTNPTEAAKFDGGIRHVYVCRLACNNSDDCPEQGDVCCRGSIYGKTYNKIGGCTPPSACEGSMVIEGDGGSEDDAAAPADGGTAPADAALTPRQ